MSPTKTKTPRARNADATRAALLEAATKRFTVLGYERTTTRDIARDAGTNISLLARYYGSKEGLYAEVLRESAHALDKLRSSDDSDLATSIVDGLNPDRWPEFGGEHPLLLLVRGLDDDPNDELRRRSLDDIAAIMGERATDTNTAGPSVKLRGDLILALVVGMLTVRRARPQGALASMDTDHLNDIAKTLVAAVARLA